MSKRLIRTSKEMRSAHIASWKRSDMKQSEYCRKHSIKQQTFSKWIREAQSHEPVQQFVEVNSRGLLPHLSQDHICELTLRNNIRIAVSAAFPIETFSEIVDLAKKI